MPLLREYDPATGRVGYRQDPLDPDKPVLLTGPVKGPITLADGTVYDVSADAVEVASHAHAGELSHHIGVIHETEGHLSHGRRGTVDYNPLTDEYDHVCDATCGPAQRTDEQADNAYDDRLRRIGYGHLVGTADYAAARGELDRLRAVARGEREI